MREVRVTRLDNGLRVATDPMPSVESATVGVWVGVGTRNERAEVNGVAHMLEHMAFKGTRRRSAREIAEQVEAVGAYMNAYTGRETTAYYLRVLKDDVPLAVDMLGDILQHSVMDPAELDRERSVILQEIGQSIDTPDDIIFDHVQQTAFPGQTLGLPVLGTADSVRRLGRDDVFAYLGGQYGAERMVLCGSGAVDHDRLVALAAEAFGDLPPRPDQPATPARYVGGEYREARDLEQLHLILGFPCPGLHASDHYTAMILSMLLGGGMSSRLFQEVREERGLAYSIYSFNSHYSDGGLFGIYAGTGEDDTEELVPVLCDQVQDVAVTASDAEVDRARAQIKASLLMGLESTMARAEQTAQHLLIYDRPVPAAEQVAKLDAVDASAVRALAQRMFTVTPTLAALGPTAKLEPYDTLRGRLT